jgi:hypothetical protein
MFQEKVMTEIVGYLECKDFKKDMKTGNQEKIKYGDSLLICP